MPLKTFLLSVHLKDGIEPEAFLGTIDGILKSNFPELDLKQKIVTKNPDFIQLYTSTKEEFSFTVHFYSSANLFSINGEMLHTCKTFRQNYIVENLKSKLNFFFKQETKVDGSQSRDVIEAVPIIKRDNQVPAYFLTSDGRVLEYDFDQVLVNEDSLYQNIKILHSPTLGNCLLLDDMQNLAEADLPYTHGLMNYGQNCYKDKDILILGGGDGGLLHELLKESPKFVTMIDIDEKVMLHCRKYLRGACGDVLDTFEGTNYRVIVGDCCQYLESYRENKRTFDVVFNDLTDIPISTRDDRDVLLQDNEKCWSFIKEILNSSLALLVPNGLYLNHAIGVNCKESLADYEDVLRKLSNFVVEFTRHTRFVPSFMEDWVFYQIKKIK